MPPTIHKDPHLTFISLIDVKGSQKYRIVIKRRFTVYYKQNIKNVGGKQISAELMTSQQAHESADQLTFGKQQKASTDHK